MKNYNITEEQIKELAKGNAKVKKMFPEVFELKKEKGKWYKCVLERGSLFEDLGNGRARGFFQNREWTDSWAYPGSDNLRLATDSEVLEALTNEAKKRGFVDGVSFSIVNGERAPIFIGKNSRYGYNSFGNKLLMNGWCIFENGKWATILPTYTKEEAEKMLNAKIV